MDKDMFSGIEFNTVISRDMYDRIMQEGIIYPEVSGEIEEKIAETLGKPYFFGLIDADTDVYDEVENFVDSLTEDENTEYVFIKIITKTSEVLISDYNKFMTTTKSLEDKVNRREDISQEKIDLGIENKIPTLSSRKVQILMDSISKEQVIFISGIRNFEIK